MKERSPIVFWLLLAATLAIDAIAIVWLAQAGPLSLASYLYDALVSGQLAVVCLWAVFAARRATWAWVATIVAVLTATVPTVRLGLLSFAEACGIYGCFAATLAVALWILKRTTTWQRLTGLGPTVWQFSLAHLLAAMTLIAVLIVSLRSSPLVSSAGDLWKFITVLTVGDVLVVVVTTMLWAADRAWLQRLAAVCVAAVALGAVETACEASGLLGQHILTTFGDDVFRFVSYTTIMSLVIFAWLELAPIVPHAHRAASTLPKPIAPKSSA